MKTNNESYEWFLKIQSGEKKYLAKAITLMESSLKEDQALACELLDLCFSFLEQEESQIKKRTRPKLIGVTGVPGAGKSTFLNSFCRHFALEKKRIAILAIDPSSSLSGGSLLGDIFRMSDLYEFSHVFIRSSPSGLSSGGISHATFDILILLLSSNFDYIFVETVGVGQAEYNIKNFVDCLLYISLPNTGDDIQSMKKGILEVIDILIVNKGDLDFGQATRALSYFKSLDLSSFIVSSLEGTGLNLVALELEKFCSNKENKGQWKKEFLQKKKWWYRQKMASFLHTSLYKEEYEEFWESKISSPHLLGQISVHLKEFMQLVLKT